MTAQKGRSILIVIFLCLFFKGQAQLTFNKVFDNNEGSEAAFSLATNESSLFVTLAVDLNWQLNQNSFLLQFFNSQGNLQFLKEYYIDNYDAYIGLSSSMKHLTNGGFMFAGSKSKLDSANWSSAMLVKLTENGDTVFTKNFGYPKFTYFYNSDITYDNDYVMIGGITPNGLNPQDYYVVKTDSNGTLLWEKSFGDSLVNDVGYSVVTMQDASIVICGVKKFSSTQYDPWIIVTDSNGVIKKQKEFTGAFKGGGGKIYKTLDGKYLMVGALDTVIQSGDYYLSPYIAKLDTDLNVLWRTVYNSVHMSFIWSLKQLSDSTIVFVGDQDGGRGWIGKINKDGSKTWEHTYYYGNSSMNWFTDFQQTIDSEFMIVGVTDGHQGIGGEDVWLVKVDSTGYLAPDTINTGTIEVSEEYATLSVFPNPCSKVATIVYNIPSHMNEARLLVFNMDGMLMHESKLSSQQRNVTLDVQQWPSGMYIIELQTATGIVTHKMLKQ